MLKVFLSFLVTALAAHASAAIIGHDDRADVRGDERARKLARATAVFAPNMSFSEPINGLVNLSFQRAQDPDGYGLCADEPFARQRVSPVACTGVLVAPDLLLTAGHCMVNWTKKQNTVTPQCEAFTWIFDDVATDADPEGPTTFSVDQIAHCKSVVYANSEDFYDVKSDVNSFGEDIALVRLDRAFPDRAFLKLATTPPAPGDELRVIGYPLGLPAKVTNQGHRGEDLGEHAFRTDLDAVGGNSGSPVLNDQDEIVGVLVRSFPDADFVVHPGESCVRMNTCDPATHRCQSEDAKYTTGTEVQKVLAIAPILANAIR